MHAKPFPVHVQTIGPADPFTAGAAERQRRIFFFQLDQRIQQHHVATFFRFKGVILHVRSVVNIRVIAIN